MCAMLCFIVQGTHRQNTLLCSPYRYGSPFTKSTKVSVRGILLLKYILCCCIVFLPSIAVTLDQGEADDAGDVAEAVPKYVSHHRLRDPPSLHMLRGLISSQRQNPTHQVLGYSLCCHLL